MDSTLIGLVAGIVLIALGTVLLIVALMRRKRTAVQADRGSVAVGGSNSGIIINHGNQNAAPAKHAGGHGLTITAIIIELVGIAVTLWHAYHMASS